ncbi:PREDICTED: testis-expressed sequence 2 protein [Ceratosolen solmsi marchali]|uniref:Testis-expressed sequence 2 protein n=1 Tax=Ceratosolen solmsi marchali TaxID=326594 RepID=A0AAJ6YEV5_9HYME|nr:PREDICTED: testis-expressed sequence 2 protein [Ceratosolen solmsi marchali]
MSSKHSPSKISLNMTKGKSHAMSVPVIRYHASDDELEELYPNTDDEKPLIPDSERASPKHSPKKSCISITNEGSNFDDCFDRQSVSLDENSSEGIPSSDPWKVLSNIKGKITKTFEERLCEMKSERKKSKHNRSMDNYCVSDYEDFGDITPTEETNSDKQDKDSPVLRKRANSSRFVGFSYIKTGLKAKKLEDDSVESGIEASELTYNGPNEEASSYMEIEKSPHINTNVLTRLKENIKSFLPETFKSSNLILTESDYLRIQLKNRIYHQMLILIITICCCYFIPLPKYFMGVLAGVFISILVQRIYKIFNQMLTLPVKFVAPVLEIPVVEHACVEKFEGWLNELPYNYNPDNYHVARTKPVFFKLQGDALQIMETRTRIPKRAVWDEPMHKPKFTKKRKYSLAGAKIDLLPSGLIRLRRWSKKYPICITLEKDTLNDITVIENSSDDEPQQIDMEADKMILEEEETDDEHSQSKDSKDIFEDCQDDYESEDMKVKLYVFARTDRQKEEWFRRLVSASEYSDRKSSNSTSKDETILGSSLSSINLESKPITPSIASVEMPSILSYQAYMSRYSEVKLSKDEATNGSSDNNVNLWINALLARILFDMHKSSDTINVIQDKIQRKLSNIKLPYFMESLLVSELVIGQGAPIINNTTKPFVDERGLWFDLDIVYEGSLTMTIETKLNLMKLKRTSLISSNSNDIIGADRMQSTRSPMFDSDMEDSPETSTEDEDGVSLATTTSSRENTPNQSSGWKFLNMVDKLASNKYFQHATELSYIKRAMEGVSNTEIRLMVSISSIEGRLLVNIPPSPSDRLWYGFKPIPKICLTAKPAVGERAVNIVYVTKWIETKLLREFEKVVVIPNMDDLIIPLCPNYPYNS